MQFDIRKQWRGDVSYTIETRTSEEAAKQFCEQYLKEHPEAKLRIWNETDKHWVLWYPEEVFGTSK